MSYSAGVESDDIKCLPQMGAFQASDPWVGKISCRRERLPTLVFLPGEVLGQRSLVGFGPWVRKESDTTERLTLSGHRNPGSCTFSR